MGSITHITDGDKVLNAYEYDAWGNVVSNREEVKNRFKFNGQQLDPITGQYYLRARYYNPVIGRFTQEDTYRGDGLNLYAYCRNNPVYYVDPTGNACEGAEQLQGAKNNGEDLVNTETKNKPRQLDKETDAEFISWVKQIRKNISDKNIRNRYNFGCAQVNIEGLDKKEFFAHSKIGNLEVHKGALPIEEILTLEGLKLICRQPEKINQIFKTLKINGTEDINGYRAWDRAVDTEFKILNEIANRLGDNTQVSGSIKMYTDLDCCKSCLNVIRQFEERYPNIEIEVIYKVKGGGQK